MFCFFPTLATVFLLFLLCVFERELSAASITLAPSGPAPPSLAAVCACSCPCLCLRVDAEIPPEPTSIISERLNRARPLSPERMRTPFQPPPTPSCTHLLQLHCQLSTAASLPSPSLSLSTPSLMHTHAHAFTPLCAELRAPAPSPARRHSSQPGRVSPPLRLGGALLFFHPNVLLLFAERHQRAGVTET